MLEVFVKTIVAIIMSLTGMYIIKAITNLKSEKSKIVQIFLILLLSIVSVILHTVEYTGLSTIIIFWQRYFCVSYRAVCGRIKNHICFVQIDF